MKINFLAFVLLINAHQALATNTCNRPVELSKVDQYVFLQGHICPGDGKKFIQYMSETGKGIKLVRLNSGGGSGADAVEIGRYIRAQKITTWTDGHRDTCASACNRIFAGGVQRIYSNANDIQTGKNSKQRFGLGYHHPRSNGDFHAAEDWYQKGIVPYLREMLPPKASTWVIQTDEGNLTADMVWLNGTQALNLGISTSSEALVKSKDFRKD
jgi:hypothetical protein